MSSNCYNSNNKNLKKKLEVIYDEYIKRLIDEIKFTWAIKRKNNDKELLNS